MDKLYIDRAWIKKFFLFNHYLYCDPDNPNPDIWWIGISGPSNND